MISEKVNGGTPVSYQYDADGLLVQAGDLTITRAPQTGLVTGTTLGVVTTANAYNTFGELIHQEAKSLGQPVFTADYTRDLLGRITRKVETIQGATDTWDYTYDPAGRLQEVHRNGARLSRYEYDTNGNRLQHITPTETITATYDAQDRLLTYGDLTYTYTANGELATKTQTQALSATTAGYSYDELGSLASVQLPDGVNIRYIEDGHFRRVGKVINNQLAKIFLYRDSSFPVAELNGDGTIEAMFIFGSRPNTPETIFKNGKEYRVIADVLGSPRLIVDRQIGSIAQRLDYDEFGKLILDTSPGFQPFGFAGGLYEPKTGLTRFGARDYASELGKWTTKDPIRFDGGNSNLYGYALNDPVNLVDLNGLYAEACRSGNEVQIIVPIEFNGSGLTAEIEKRFRNAIETSWTGKFGALNVVTKTASGAENKIEVQPGAGTSFVRWTKRSGVWFAEELDWVAAHEAGHLMGLPDRYRRHGKDDTTARPGYEGNIMAEYPGVPSEADILRILEKNKPGGYCPCQ